MGVIKFTETKNTIMKKMKLYPVALALCVSVLMTSCFSITHTVGAGAKGSETKEAKQWFALFGLVPINDVDSKAMAGGATDYTINTQRSFVDGLIGIFTGIASIYPATVKVTK